MFKVGDRVQILFDDRELEDDGGDIWYLSLGTVEDLDGPDGVWVAIEGIENRIVGGPLVVPMLNTELRKVESA